MCPFAEDLPLAVIGSLVSTNLSLLDIERMIRFGTDARKPGDVEDLFSIHKGALADSARSSMDHVNGLCV